MQSSQHPVIISLAACALGTCMLLMAPGCQGTSGAPTANAMAVADTAAPSEPQQSFDSAQAAAQALEDAVNNPESGQMKHLFGPALHELVSGDPVEDKNAYQAFARKAKEKLRVEQKNDAFATVYLGNDDWPFAIPVARSSDGKWFFDTQAGKAEILARRIGKNELDTIEVMRAYVQAQREYASKDRDGAEVLKYAQRLVSHPGQKDGLYWPSTSSADESPFGPLAADASAEGYTPLSGSRKNPIAYHGYYFHILKAQGPAAPGGAYNYVINGNMIAGFAFVAAPAEYGQSGVMTFIVSHQGKVYQRDLGANTPAAFQAMQAYNPDSTWTLVKQ